ncbi:MULTISPECIES: transcription/translation regulatory transformer protein RfaH [Pseudoalteromonas]|uniref:Transcriptional regulator n=1 Tax=Pseudoalteromonas amylolytica TaxID=1859457 RepID=A0A1S1MZR0_9GAMM|nr:MULTISPECIES: transcription/translation regulatory transformer protein RfaH [Pseudoalteromonas]OHU90693.1 transcriptional regulator [Pseudoalteromonas sp. JW3]OHU92687.1 transcriptional regulator [Pseudoalteromonas amylolytica]
MERWYLLYCKPKQEARAQANLSNQGIECCYPKYTKRKTANSPLIEQPLFPRYLFVKLDPYSVHFSAVKYTRGISDFVRYGTKLQVVPDGLVEQFKQHNTPELDCEITQGDTVQISEGCYKDLLAIYHQPEGDIRSVLLIKLLNQHAPVVVDNSSFKKI